MAPAAKDARLFLIESTTALTQPYVNEMRCGKITGGNLWRMCSIIYSQITLKFM